jgi:hypothetical protein
MAKNFPKLKYPIHTFNLKPEVRLILLAYDLTYRWLTTASLRDVSETEGITLLHDTEANLNGLGTFIANEIGPHVFDPCLTDDGIFFGFGSKNPNS